MPSSAEWFLRWERRPSAACWSATRSSRGEKKAVRAAVSSRNTSNGMAEARWEVHNQPWDEPAPEVALDERPGAGVGPVRPATRWRHCERIGMGLLTVESHALRIAKEKTPFVCNDVAGWGFISVGVWGIMISMPMHYLRAAYDR